jgi:transcriptional regulator with XRE-family HTH domain
MAAFGAEVRKLRRQSEFSTRQLALMLGMSQPAITQIETGKRANIDFRLVWDFAQALGVSAAHLVTVCERPVAVEEAKRLGSKGRRTK